MKNKKIIYFVLFAIIIIGIIVGATLKFNFSIDYLDAKRINIYVAKQIDIEEIKDMVDDIFGTKNKVEYVETFNDMVSITIPNIYEDAKETELKNELINRINNKYQTEIKTDDITSTIVPHFRGRDFIKRYILPITIVAIIILVYFTIRYNKIGSVKVALNTVGHMALIEAVYISLIAITRFEINKYTVPFAMLIAVIVLLVLTTKYENDLKKQKAKSKKN